MSSVKGRKIRNYEECHKIIGGELFKLCNCHEEYFPNEDGWFPCTDEYFYKNKRGMDGLFPNCKKCSIKSAAIWETNPKNRERVLKSARKRNSKPDFKIKMRRYSKEQRENGYAKTYQQKHLYKFRQYRLNREQNKTHTISKEEWNKCKEYFNNSCAYCGISEEEAKIQQGQYLHKEHVDHNGANDLSNCVPACKSCNSKKNIFTLNEWYNENNPNFNQERFDKIHKWLQEDYKLHII